MADVPAIAGTISALNLVPVLGALEQLGFDVGRLLARVGTTMEVLTAPHARVPATLEFTFWDAVGELIPDPMISLQIAECVPVGALGAYEYLLRNSPTLRAAIEQANRFERVMDDYSRLSIIEHGDEAALRIWREGGVPHPPSATECLFFAVLRVAGQILPDEKARELRFIHPAPLSPRVYEERLGCPVRFDRPHNEIAFRRGLLDEPLSSADPVLSQVLEEHMAHVLELVPDEDPLIHRARTVLGESLQHGGLSLEDLAHALHLSPRTLRRRLDEHGTSYKTLLDELRREFACYYTARTEATFEDIASRLGFGDTSAFYRAFKRWTATTPAAYRARQNGRG